MYEELVQFLLGKKEEFTEVDLDEFIDLLNKALDIVDEYDICKREAIIENMVDNTNIIDKEERKTVSKAIDNILQLEECEEMSMDSQKEVSVPLRNIKFSRHKGGIIEEECSDDKKRSNEKFDKKKKNKKKKTERKLRREERKNKKNKEGNTNIVSIEPVNKKPCLENTEVSVKEHSAEENNLTLPVSNDKNTKKNTSNTIGQFKFDIGSLEENNYEGPEYEFNIDE